MPRQTPSTEHREHRVETASRVQCDIADVSGQTACQGAAELASSPTSCIHLHSMLSLHLLIHVIDKNLLFNDRACADFPNVIAESRSYGYDVSDAMFSRTASFCLRFVLCIMTQQKATFLTPKFELGRDFCPMHLLPKFHHLCLLIWKISC